MASFLAITGEGFRLLSGRMLPPHGAPGSPPLCSLPLGSERPAAHQRDSSQPNNDSSRRQRGGFLVFWTPGRSSRARRFVSTSARA
jgi:hypothetical protein